MSLIKSEEDEYRRELRHYTFEAIHITTIYSLLHSQKLYAYEVLQSISTSERKHRI